MHNALRSQLALGSLLLSFALIVTAAGPKAYVGNFKDNSVSVIDTGTGQVVATVPVSAGPHGMSATPDGRIVYVSGDGSSEVSVIDAATDRVTRKIEVGKTPHGLAMTPDGKLLLVGVYGEDRVALIDTATQAVVLTASLPYPHPHGVASVRKRRPVSRPEAGQG